MVLNPENQSINQRIVRISLFKKWAVYLLHGTDDSGLRLDDILNNDRRLNLLLFVTV